MTRVLVLRPEPAASATVGRARALGLEAVSIPLFELESVQWQLPDPGLFDGLLLTSANALRYGGEKLERLRAMPVYAVGATTGDAARAAGFHLAVAGDSDLRDLVKSIDTKLKLLHLAGEHRIPVEAAQQITSVTVYRARALDQVDLGAASGSVVLVHSPRAARRFNELAEQQVLDRLRIAVAAISRNAAAAAGTGWAKLAFASAPTDEALLVLAARLCNNPPPQ